MDRFVERHLDSNNVASGAILVLGMHRSGTSCLAGSLQQRGLHLGEVYEWRPYNLKGNRENQRIMDLNNAVLAHAGGSWDHPPQHLSWSPAHAAERDAIVRELHAGCAGAWGFKDPRTLLTLAFWREGIADARLVGTFRHPAQVARSLHARDPNMSLAQGLELWRLYNERLLACHEQAAFPLVSFDADEDGYRRAVDRIARELGLAAASPAEDFFERSLRTPEADTVIGIPAPVRALYQRLLGAAA
jgi:hypothetical protein